MVAPKKRSIPGAGAAGAAEAAPLRPVTRSCTSTKVPRGSARESTDAERIASEVLEFLADDTRDDASRVPGFYRFAECDPGRSAVTLLEKGEPNSSIRDAVAAAIGFPSPFLAVDLNDRLGVWQTDPPLVQALGDDPRKRLRKGLEGGEATRPLAAAPAGLKNLGATCYLNSLLQYLFFNVDFRQRLLRASSESLVVGALQRVFALLAEGDQSTVDPSEFIEAAHVDALEQEDATEFSALLLDWLERELSTDKTKGGGNFIPELFQGEVCQILQCMVDPEHKFERREPFIELRARITPTSGTGGAAGQQSEAPKAKSKSKGPGPTVRLEQLLADTAFPDEVLDGENQYYCSHCDSKVDARKSIRLTKLPPYLNITIERHHYDLQKGERRKLNNVVTFPRRLELWLDGVPLPNEMCHDATSASGKLVVYECIGYLEHLSDSAHTGHYTATLLQEDFDAVEAMNAASKMATQSADHAPMSQGKQPEEPPLKRPRFDGADVAAGVPQLGKWWTLDDDTVAPVTWTASKAQLEGVPRLPGEDTAKQSLCSSLPDRIESQSAYLALYRKSDHVPGQLAVSETSSTAGLPAPLASYIASVNGSFAAEQRLFAAKAARVDEFMNERRRAVNGLVQALRQERILRKAASVTQLPDPTTYSCVPAAWLNSFLRGEDRSLDDIMSQDEMQKVAPVIYGPALLSGREKYRMDTIDPLALWCGEVKLLPTSALEALGGLGGLDKSLFIQAETAWSPEACEAVLNVFKIWCKEQRIIEKTLEGKLTFAEAREFQSSEPVWVSVRLHNVWKRALPYGVNKVTAWTGFLSEVYQLRWGNLFNAMSSAKHFKLEEPEHGSKAALTSASEDQPTDPPMCSTPIACTISLLDGMLCNHGLVKKPRSGILVRRADVMELLEVSAEKEKAYATLWPKLRCVPRLITGLPDGQLLGFNDLCTECPQPGRSVLKSMPDIPMHGQRCLLVRRRYASGNLRKLGELSLRAAEDLITGDALRTLVKEQLKLPVQKLFVPSADAAGDLRELENTEVLADSVTTIVVEKDEHVGSVVREAAAFEGSIFRTTSS